MDVSRHDEGRQPPALSEEWWSLPAETLLAQLQTDSRGLPSAEAARRLGVYGRNTLRAEARAGWLRILLRQFESPLLLILIAAALVSGLVHEWADAIIVLAIVFGSALLTFYQEYSATAAVEKLRARISVKVNVLRDGAARAVPLDEIVPGDVVLLSAGSLIPADGVVLEVKDFFVNQAALTGETFAVEKTEAPPAAGAALAGRTNSVFMGTNVRSGTATALVVQTGGATAYGRIAAGLERRQPETEFERGIRHFGYLLTQVMLVLVLVVFAANVVEEKPVIDALLFSIALAVGLAPELLPAIVTLTLSKGAQHMAAQGVIVRRLNSIENLGSMDVLCSDKTGTLTVGTVQLDAACGPDGSPAPEVLRLAAYNAALQSGLANPLDEALVAAAKGQGIDLGVPKVDELPYDFVRKRLSVAADVPGEGVWLITKGAFESVLAVCTRVQTGAEPAPLDAGARAALHALYEKWSGQGMRVLGVAGAPADGRTAFTRDDERDLIFLGFLLFLDPPKPDIQATLRGLAERGVALKVITGDNVLVARHLGRTVGLAGFTAGPAGDCPEPDCVLTGSDLNAMSDDALWQRAERTSIFAEVDPNQKERIIGALRRKGHVVGYMGDGINDAPALQAADVGISVDSAVDVAKEAADLVLLQQDLSVLTEGIDQGRKTFANTLKYIYTTTSANFGNMLSMAGASLFLPFLPLLAKQILLNNFLSDIPGLTIAGDNVDAELVARPRRWDIRAVRNFMLVFGTVSSAFDYLTFGFLLRVVHAGPDRFRTGWFVESLLTELAVALVVRTRKPFYRSRPGRLLWFSTLVVFAITLWLPYSPLGPLLSLEPLPPWIMGVLLAITAAYVAAAEVVKRVFYRRFPG